MLNSLRNIRFFRSCPDVELALLNSVLHARTLPADEILYEQGQPSDSFYLLLSGRLLLAGFTADRRPEGPGDQILEPEHLVGASAVLGINRRSTVKALTTSTVLVFPIAGVQTLLEKSPWLKRLLEEIVFKARFSDQILGWLRHTGVFRSLPPRELEEVLSNMRLKHYKAGTAVIRQGERGASVGLIVRGEARMMLDLGKGKKVEIAALTEGDLYGETGLLGDTIRETTVQAITPLSVLTLHREDLLAIAEEAPYLMQAITRVVSDRYEDAIEARAADGLKGIAVVIVGRAPRLGRTTLTLQLAASLEREGRSVAVVDATGPWAPAEVTRMLRVPVASSLPTDAGQRWSAWSVGTWRSIGLYQLERQEGCNLEAVSAWVSDLKERHDVVLIDTPALAVAGSAAISGLIEPCEWVLHVTRHPGIEQLPFEVHRRDVLRVVPDGGPTGSLPYIGRDIQRMPWESELARRFTNTGIPWVITNPDALSSVIVRRIKRAVLRRQVGIALAGGGNWGFSHIGVLQVLEENRVAIDMVAGTSCGALIGALFCNGMSGAQIEKMILKFVFPGFIRYLTPSFFLMGSGLLSGAGFERFTSETFKGREFTDLRYPFWPNAMDAATGEEIVFRKGPVFHGVTAAAALPGFFAPYAHDGRVLLDGGFINNLPLGILYEMGCNLSIGVNCIPHLAPVLPQGPTDYRRRVVGRLAHLQTGLSGMGDGRDRLRMRPMLAPALAPFTAISTLNMVMRGIQMLCHRIGEETGRLADVYIAPEVGGAQWFEFHKVKDMIAAGRRGAQDSLDRILEVCAKDE